MGFHAIDKDSVSINKLSKRVTDGIASTTDSREESNGIVHQDMTCDFCFI